MRLEARRPRTAVPMASTDSPPLSYAHDEKGADDIITVHISEQDSKLQLKHTLAVVHENAPKVFGLERWNSEEHTYLVEGPIDSLFLPKLF